MLPRPTTIWNCCGYVFAPYVPDPPHKQTKKQNNTKKKKTPTE
jgi:hypothetical protein